MATARQIADQLRRFVSAVENPSSGQSSSLSDVGFLLLQTKDQLLAPDQRSDAFLHEFISRPTQGVDLIIRVIVALQGIVNASGSSSKISNILGRNNSNSSRKRKAAVAEADSIECLKILLEKSPLAWRSLLENATSLEVVLYSVNSPQLDSKCYALEIVLLLLDQPQGYAILWKTLTLLAARNRDYVRLSIFVSQLKHGLHTAKLHIQILVVRLMNKLLGHAPSANHRLLAQVEASLAQFSPDYLEKLILEMNQPLGGLDILLEELSIFRSLSTSPSQVRYENGGSNGRKMHTDSSIYGYPNTTDSESDSASKGRRLRGNNGKIIPTTVAKSVERQRLKKQDGSGRSNGQTPSSSYYPNNRGNYFNTFDPHTEEAMYQSSRDLHAESRSRENFGGGGGMRRAKSESAMNFPLDNEDQKSSGLKRMEEARQPEYAHPLQASKMMSRSIHDVSRRAEEERSASLLRSPNRPPSVQDHRTRSLQRAVSPPRARFADPPIMDTPQTPHGGFSYLFPGAPVVANVVHKRAVTPSMSNASERGERGDTSSLSRPASRGPVSPVPSYSTTRTDGQVTYIPINLEKDGLTPIRRYEKREDRLRSPSVAASISEDVRDAFSKFDFLNDYEGGNSPHSRTIVPQRDY
ncbi:hypothetical protein PFISCL1PPCAC_27348 [Pristionchus fissidentatus]|uniref:Uncharacterized protein n=1 Tax=Pristionchus fissidentatus TaxID=1538716 RepID=A0AAV5WY33_9BILA|nr:hypothetical protein PFISCL1PPCAC_27348 [Pristionchus fissidentatus]